jgi:lipopolysaccharide/colanic/teichoic acid biosynthesis glycosyltransferase
MAPAFAVIAVVIKLSSRGPVFFRQERIGFKGARFKLVKFRTMAVDNDDSVHHEYVRNLIENGTEACVNKDGAEVYKLVDDDRITGVGRFLRKWSIDELPQFWNVLKGDMSVVGPRPAIGYEVAVYKEWHRLRLLVSPGVSGLWQIAGRSRVDFDEMVFQDVMYGYNQSLLTDITICLHTVPAVFTRRGAL